MADIRRPSIVEQDVDQAITALKKGACLLKYGRRGKPKFCPFRHSADETKLVWYYGKYEKQLELHHVSKIIPGQRTPTFQRYPRPEKEYQSFSLLHNDRSLDLRGALNIRTCVMFSLKEPTTDQGKHDLLVCRELPVTTK